MRTGKKYFKDGDPEVYAYIGEETWKRMTPPERAKWTPYSEVDKAPISAEVIEFNQLRKESAKKEDELKKQIADLKAQLKDEKPDDPKTSEPLDEETERKLLLEECRQKGIKVTHNMKLETLKKRLADANDTE